MQNTTIPNLIVVGAGKAGTTSLHNYLDAHPQVFGAGDKELMYFSRFMDKGVDWYKSNFKVRDGVKVYFESTPQYSFRDEFPHVPQNIYDLNPDMKIIYIVREPIKRIVSHFNHWSRTQAHTFKDIEKSIHSTFPFTIASDSDTFFVILLSFCCESSMTMLREV